MVYEHLQSEVFIWCGTVKVLSEMFPGGVGRSTQYGTTTILAELNVWQHFESGLEAVQSNPPNEYSTLY